MQVILITPTGHKVLTLRLSGWRLWLLVALLASLIGLGTLAALRAGMAMSSQSGSPIERAMQWWQAGRDDAVARELGTLKAQIDQLESTLAAMSGDKARPAGPSPARASTKPPSEHPVADRTPTLSDLEGRIEKISVDLDQLFEARQRLLETLATGAAAKPIEAPMSSNFGVRNDPFTGERAFHRGLDFVAPAGTPVHGVGDGVVEYIGDAPRYGKMVDIRHSARLVSRYAHLEGIEVTTGMPVMAGQRIARVGSTGRSTGAHLHFELILDGSPVNPKSFLARFYNPGRNT